MENDKFYKIVFYVGCVWNFAVSVSLFILVGSLPDLLKIEPPNHSLFIYFNLYTIFVFGMMQFMVARDMCTNRNMVFILMWAKFIMLAVFVYVLIIDAPVKELTGFLAPGMVIDLIFGLLFWRYLVYSRKQIVAS
ncbi:MAG: hypothetical protein V1779_07750 [bacterium]